ncbi:uncharacterized protein LOC120659079 [Panicum virgatum]|uniref:uncharacterized protein LOC120659079 n=1 Tax=Panicum virgatum TaxID=38727 RepID=UPI0019D67C1A|nr:uncharacterized protein LOC120659079 [Panicum virgatum]
MACTPPPSPKAAAAKAAQDDEIARRTAQEATNAAALEAQRLAKERQDAHDTALARALKAEEEAAATTRSRDAALECAAAEAAIVPPKSSRFVTDSAPADLHAAMLLHEAAALLNLHAQAVAVTNIRSLVSIILDVDSGNFKRWCDQFLLTLGKFSLQDHVYLDASAAASPDWTRMDCGVKSWILGTLTDDLAEIISSQGASAKDAWLAVESLFLGNREACSIQLETKFRNFVQGDLSVTDYCRRMKKMADDLVVTGEIVTNRTLVLNVIRGLNERFTHIGTLLRRARPFPSFLEARDDLVLEEISLENQQTPAAALTASTKSAASAPQQQQDENKTSTPFEIKLIV